MYHPSPSLNSTQSSSINQSWEQNQRARVRTRGKVKSRNSAQGRGDENSRKLSEEEVNSPGKNLQNNSQLNSTIFNEGNQNSDLPRRHRASSRSSNLRNQNLSSTLSGQQPQPPPSSSSQLPQIANSNHSNNNSNSGKKNLFATQNAGNPSNRHDITMITDECNHSAVSSIKGLKPGNPNWINQDNYFLMDNTSSSSSSSIPSSISCVFDGHGEHGHLVSRRCRELLPVILQNTNYDLMKSFSMIQNDLTSCEIDTRCSGATCNMVLQVHSLNGNGYGKLIIANCGDSRCVLGKKLSNGNYAPVQLSNDHKPDNPDERKRVIAAGGHLGCRQALVNQGSRGMVSVPVGPTRVWYQYKGDTLGLAMSRSLGDSVVHRFGVTAEPEITEYQLNECDEFVILASDGIWDVVDNNQAVQVIQNFISKGSQWDPHEAAVWLSKFARARWEKMSAMIDDITCIVVKLKTSERDRIERGIVGVGGGGGDREMTKHR